MFFNKEGFLNLDECVENQPSFQKIMQDGIVTDEELAEQSQTILKMLAHIEKNYNPEQQAEIRELLVETNVLYAAYRFKELQDLKN